MDGFNVCLFAYGQTGKLLFICHFVLFGPWWRSCLGFVLGTTCERPFETLIFLFFCALISKVPARHLPWPVLLPCPASPPKRSMNCFATLTSAPTATCASPLILWNCTMITWWICTLCWTIRTSRAFQSRRSWVSFVLCACDFWCGVLRWNVMQCLYIERYNVARELDQLNFIVSFCSVLNRTWSLPSMLITFRHQDGRQEDGLHPQCCDKGSQQSFWTHGFVQQWQPRTTHRYVWLSTTKCYF